MIDYAPWARIVLRYVLGAVFMGSSEVGDVLASDPDLVAALSVGLGVAVESAYVYAKRKGWAT